MLFILTLIAIITALVSTYYRIYFYWERHSVPYERPWPIVGNLKGIGKSLHFRDVNRRIYRRFKGQTPFAGMFMFFMRTAFIIDLELIKHVLIKDFSNFHDRGVFNNVKDDPLTGHLVTLEGDQWRAMRNKMTPVFTSGKMKFMFPTIVKVAARLVKVMESKLGSADSCILEFKDLSARYTTDVIGMCAFGLESNCLENPQEEFRCKGRKIFDSPRHAQLVQAFILTNPVLARKLRLKLFSDDVSDFFLNTVRSTVEYRLKNNIKRNDFMDLMIELKANDEELAKQGDGIDLSNGLTIEQLAAQAFVFFVAGFDTSSSTMAFCLYLLALHQAEQDKLRSEIIEVLERHDDKLNYDAMKEMEYLDQVLSETLRLYPALPQLLRTTMADYRVPNSDLIIEKGTSVIVPIDAIHHDPELFPDPESFLPERFTSDEIKQRHSCAYLPFGDGPRNCIGLRFGKMQSKVGLIYMLKHFRFSVSPLTEIPLRMDNRNFMIAPENGVHLQIERIQN